MHAAKAMVVLWAASAALGCTTERRVLGAQCPSPHAEGASRLGDAGPHAIYGTSCAPCGEEPVRFDARGCPIYVTFESCGGDICVGEVLVREGDEDAGVDEDAGALGEDDAG